MFCWVVIFFFFFFFNDTATTEIYTLSLHDALPISGLPRCIFPRWSSRPACIPTITPRTIPGRSEEHTSELQSQSNLVCRLLLEKKKKNIKHSHVHQRNSHDHLQPHLHVICTASPLT